MPQCSLAHARGDTKYRLRGTSAFGTFNLYGIDPPVYRGRAHKEAPHAHALFGRLSLGDGLFQKVLIFAPGAFPEAGGSLISVPDSRQIRTYGRGRNRSIHPVCLCHQLGGGTVLTRRHADAKLRNSRGSKVPPLSFRRLEGACSSGGCPDDRKGICRLGILGFIGGSRPVSLPCTVQCRFSSGSTVGDLLALRIAGLTQKGIGYSDSLEPIS